MTDEVIECIGLRDYFAVHALVALFQGSFRSIDGTKIPDEHADEMAWDAYAVADAMLREREK